MNALDVVEFRTQQVKTEVSTRLCKNVMEENEASMQKIMDMAPDVSAMTGVGKQFNIKL